MDSLLIQRDFSYNEKQNYTPGLIDQAMKSNFEHQFNSSCNKVKKGF